MESMFKMTGFFSQAGLLHWKRMWNFFNREELRPQWVIKGGNMFSRQAWLLASASPSAWTIYFLLMLGHQLTCAQLGASPRIPSCGVPESYISNWCNQLLRISGVNKNSKSIAPELYISYWYFGSNCYKIFLIDTLASAVTNKWSLSLSTWIICYSLILAIDCGEYLRWFVLDVENIWFTFTDYWGQSILSCTS